MAKGDNVDDFRALLKEIGDIKRLLVLALSRQGASQADVAEALGISQSSISRMFPKPSRKAPKGSRPK